MDGTLLTSKVVISPTTAAAVKAAAAAGVMVRAHRLGTPVMN
jgi:hydroxymethylpyrimidine pyrophosphatase-like HAD family hydrolase